MTLNYYRTPEGGIGGGHECPHDFVGLSNAPGFKQSKRIRNDSRKIGKFEPVQLVVRGRFAVCHDANCFVGMYWASYRVEVREYLSIQPLQKALN